jgi:hypothetical protein
MARLTAARRGWSGGLDIVILPGSTVPILTNMTEFGKSEPRSGERKGHRSPAGLVSSGERAMPTLNLL